MSLGPQCWKCRERRVRCGSETPKCAKCEAKGLVCPGYGPNKPLRWKKPQNPARMGNRQRNQVSLIEVRPLLWSSLVQISSIDQEIVYYNENVAPDLVPIDSPSNPFRWPLKVTGTANVPLFLNHIHASISAFHRMARRRLAINKADSLPSQNTNLSADLLSSDPEEPTFCRYRASALRGLNDALSKNRSNASAAALAGAMLLLFAQLQQGAYGPWRIHLDGFKTLINLYGGYEAFFDRQPHCNFVLSNLLVIDVVSATMLPVGMMTPDTINWHLAYLKALPHVDYNSSPTPIPIPQDVLESAILVNLARASRCRPTNGVEIPILSLSGILAELEVNRSWDNGPKDASSPSSLTTRTETLKRPDKPSGYALFTECFRSAVMLYAIEGYSNTEMSFGRVTDTMLAPSVIQEVRNVAFVSLINSIHALFQAKKDRYCQESYWKFIFWPLVVAGVHSTVCNRDRENFGYICARLYEMAADLGTLSMRDAVLFLQGLWIETSSSRPDATLRTWDDIFVDAPLFLL
ncbi:Zn(II)2Cys6 transcription factor [Aspergillus stella-maris]|uniref:Zn(II)2Cys6 transcription factor n=1 Tax=Aspergillus stella-maris TaxID=1810926 RepID=UPI003CCDA55C